MANRKFDINQVLATPVFSEIYKDSKEAFVKKVLTSPLEVDFKLQAKLIKYSFLLLNYQLSKLSESNGGENTEGFARLYDVLKTIGINASEEEFEIVWGIDGVNTKYTYYFFLGISGFLSQNSIKARIDLREFKPSTGRWVNWENRVVTQIFEAVILLIRKANGTKDIEQSLGVIAGLRNEQVEFEEKYLKNQPAEKTVGKAVNLLGYYHLCKILTETAQYLIQGYDYKANLSKEVQRHAKYARESLSTIPRFYGLVTLLEWTCIQLQRNSIWFKTIGLGSSIARLCRKLGSNKMIDLLHSQQKAIDNNLLDPASSVTVVQMPTSAGKTLLAEFNILQTKALNSSAKIIYVVPTRALINQVLNDLREDFEGLGLSVEKSSGATEIDPSEDLFLQTDIDVLVVTPEKLDLLVRKKHPVAEDVSLIIVDEAHNIRDGQRGAKLELLLSILKREKPNARFMLLSPFLPNAGMLKEWLADGKNAISPIKVDWKPSDKIFLGVKEKRNKTQQGFELEVLPSAHSLGNSEKILVQNTVSVDSTGTKERLFEFSSKYFATARNSVLYLCYGKKTADNKARFLFENINAERKSEQLDLAIKFIDEEMGEKTALSQVLKKGIAIHHAGLTDDVRMLVEHLIRKNEIQHICATSTVAQGINFPISTVYFDDTRKGNQGHLSVNEFQNIAGRAGRTLVDNVGKVVFPFNSKPNTQRAKDFLRAQSLEITSALVDLIVKSEDIINTFSQLENPMDRAKLFDDNEALAS